jgi:hypothetical protein
MPIPGILPAVESWLNKPRRMLIGAEWRDGASGEWIDTPDPATGKTIGNFPAGGAAEADAAVAAARRAFNGAWRKLTPYERGRLLQKCASAIESRADELAQLVTLDNGKPLWEAKKEVATAVAWVDYYAGWCTKLTGDAIPLSLPGSYLNYTTREPLGVVVGITPPNYPLTMPLYKAAPALATGNTVILKPAEQTSLVAQHPEQLVDLRRRQRANGRGKARLANRFRPLQASHVDARIDALLDPHRQPQPRVDACGTRVGFIRGDDPVREGGEGLDLVATEHASGHLSSTDGLMSAVFASQSTVTVVPSANVVCSLRNLSSRNRWPVISSSATRRFSAAMRFTLASVSGEISASRPPTCGTPPLSKPWRSSGAYVVRIAS